MARPSRRAVSPIIGTHNFVMSVPDARALTALEQVEYTALRDTIRERGTARICIFAGGLVAWGALATAGAALSPTPLGMLLPLVVLASVFEAVFALHVGAERVGRYLQVFYEANAGEARWEHAAMAFGRPRGAARTDALFIVPFLLAGLFNLVPALALGPTQAELIFVGGAHALFVLRLVAARARARSQREIDLARFGALRESGGQ
jgi:hypothetical protein